MPSNLPWVRSVLETTVARWQTLTAHLPAELLARTPAAGEWSALDCLQHLLDTEREVFAARVGYLLTGTGFPAYDPGARGGRPAAGTDPTALAAAFAGFRERSLRELAAVREEDLPRTARHAELGIVNLENLLNEWAAHDLMHTVQAERALMQPFIAACGPWQPYFRDHIAAEG